MFWNQRLVYSGPGWWRGARASGVEHDNARNRPGFTTLRVYSPRVNARDCSSIYAATEGAIPTIRSCFLSKIKFANEPMGPYDDSH